MQPFFSIIVPVYNVEKYLDRCINSLLNQTFRDYEILLVDDGSTDGSGELCKKYAKQYANIQVYQKGNAGLASARNHGLKYVTGSYISFIDSDDWLENKTYEELHKILLDNPVDILKFGYHKRENGRIMRSVTSSLEEGIYNAEKIRKYVLKESISQKKLFDYNKQVILSAWAHVYKTQFIKDNSLEFISEREVLNEDHLFNISCLIKAQSMYVARKELYNYDMRLNSLTLCYKKDMLRRKKNIYRQYLNKLDEANIRNDYQDRLADYYVDNMYACITNECGKYSSQTRGKAVQNMRIIMNDSSLKNYIRVCNFKEASLQGKAIIILMRLNMPTTLYFLYKIKKSL